RAVNVDGVGQKFVDAADTECLTSAGTVTASVQPFDDFLDTECAGSSITVKIQFEDELDRLGFNWVNVEFFLDLHPPLLGFDQPIAERGHRPVPESLPGVFLHRSDDMLRILF